MGWQQEKDFVASLSIEEVVQAEMKLRQKGPHLEGICPFHSDKRAGSFKVTPGKQRFKCFACGAGGDKIDFISKLYNLNFEEAIHFLCEKHGYREYGRFSNMKPIPKKPLEEKPKAAPDVLHTVYSCFIEASGGITPKLEKYLKGVRQLSDEEIKQNFFIFPNPMNPSFWQVFLEKLDKAGIRRSALLNVPGFYLKLYSEKKRYFFVKHTDAYGIVCRDEQGRISGIQLGFFHKHEKFKYLWFSSGSLLETEGTDGTASGAPLDITRSASSCIAITEGKYKALALARMGVSVINIHGVSNLRNLSGTVQTLASEIEQRKKQVTILIALDSDCFHNTGVAAAVKHIAEITSQYKTYVLYWNSAFGKGIDDVKDKSKIKKVLAETFIENIVDPLLKNEQKTCIS